MGIDFRFYLNRQGIQGQRGQRGEQGFSPLISVKTQTASEYVLTVQNEDGSFDTPNLRGNAIANTGGTYIRYNPVTEEMYTDDADYATTAQAGVVLLSTYAQLAAGGSEDLIPTSADVYDLIQAQMSSIGQGYVTQTEFDNYTAATALTLNGIAGDISALDTGKMSFTDLVSSLVQGNNITLVADAENKTITINAAGTDLSNYVDKTTDQTIDGWKTFLKSPILKGTTNSVLKFKNGNNNDDVANLTYTFSSDEFRIKSYGDLIFENDTTSINLDNILTSASLTNYVTTNTAQTITQSKTFDGYGELHFTMGSNGIYFEDAHAPSLERIRIFGRSHSAGTSYNDLTLKSYMDIQFELSGNGGTTRLSDIKSSMALANTALQSADIQNMQTTTNLVTSVSSASTDSQYPSAKLFYDTVGDIETLINAL